MSQTIFDKILCGEIPADKVYEDELVCAFRDINPKAPVHVLVIPKKKIARYADLATWGEQETGAFFQRIADVARVLGLEESGYRIIFNNGSDAGQEVEYLHAHILGWKTSS